MESAVIRAARSVVRLASALFAAAAVAQPLPSTAPPFELPFIGTAGYLRSIDAFADSERTFLIFWDSACPRCVESLLASDAFYAEQDAGETGVIGVHTGHDPSEARRLIETHGVRYPQVQDMDGETAFAYGVQPSSFTLVLVSRDGRVLARRSEPDRNVDEVMRDMLATANSPRQASETERPSTSPGSYDALRGFTVHGDERIRFLSIDQQGAAAVGPFGEDLEPGNALLYRFDLTITRRLTRNLRVGALLRIGNEDEQVLELGPEYLGVQWGSAFAEIEAKDLRARLGYYEIFSTPLTLMRWDWDDNPRIGGSAGCGCGATAGVLLVESLEELNPELVFEGALADYRKWGFDTRAFYAIPRRADQTTRDEGAATGAERASYSLETAGVETVWRRDDSRTASTWAAGLRLIGAWENERSVDFVALGYPWPDPFTSSAIATVNWNIPLVRHIDLEGEWILWNEATQDAEACCDTTYTSSGEGGLAGIVFERQPGWKVRFDYLYLDGGFYSPFAALSYAPNREGPRASLEVPLFGDVFLASLFYKRLRETEAPYEGAEKLTDSLGGISFDAEFPAGVGGSIGWLENSLEREGPVAAVDDFRSALVVNARYRFEKAAVLQAEYQRLGREITAGELREDSTADLYSVYLTVRF